MLNTDSDEEGISYHHFEEFNTKDDMEDPKFLVGVSFKNVEMLQMVLRQHTIEKAFDYTLQRMTRSVSLYSAPIKNANGDYTFQMKGMVRHWSLRL